MDIWRLVIARFSRFSRGAPKEKYGRDPMSTANEGLIQTPRSWPAAIAAQIEAILAIEPEIAKGVNGPLPLHTLNNPRRKPFRLAERLAAIESAAPFKHVVVAEAGVDLTSLLAAWREGRGDGHLLILQNGGAVDVSAVPHVFVVDISGSLHGDPIVQRALCNWLRWTRCERLHVAEGGAAAELARAYRRPLEILLTISGVAGGA